MAAHAQRQCEQVCSNLNQQRRLCSSGPKARWQGPGRPAADSSPGCSQQLRCLPLAIGNQPAAPRAVWKKLVQQQVSLMGMRRTCMASADRGCLDCSYLQAGLHHLQPCFCLERPVPVRRLLVCMGLFLHHGSSSHGLGWPEPCALESCS